MSLVHCPRVVRSRQDLLHGTRTKGRRRLDPDPRDGAEGGEEYVLSPKLFPQPEGITFKNNGDMYISNEGVSTKSTLLKFLYKL